MKLISFLTSVFLLGCQTVGLGPVFGHPAPSGYVQSAENFDGSGVTFITSVPFTGSVTAGDAIYVVFYSSGSSGTGMTFSDTLGTSIANIHHDNFQVSDGTMVIGCGVATSSGSDAVSAAGVSSIQGGVIYEVAGYNCNLMVPDTQANPVSSDNESPSASPSPCPSASNTNQYAGNYFALGTCAAQYTDTCTATFSAGTGWSHAVTMSGVDYGLLYPTFFVGAGELQFVTAAAFTTFQITGTTISTCTPQEMIGQLAVFQAN
jgi:hypothetical protein